MVLDLALATVKAHFHAYFVVICKERIESMTLAVVTGLLEILVRIYHGVVTSAQNQLLLLSFPAFDHLAYFLGYFLHQGVLKTELGTVIAVLVCADHKIIQG